MQHTGACIKKIDCNNDQIFMKCGFYLISNQDVHVWDRISPLRWKINCPAKLHTTYLYTLRTSSTHKPVKPASKQPSWLIKASFCCLISRVISIIIVFIYSFVFFFPGREPGWRENTPARCRALKKHLFRFALMANERGASIVCFLSPPIDIGDTNEE